MSGKTSGELEYSWFATRTRSANKKLNDMKREYFASKVSDATGRTRIEELEKKWLQAVAGVISEDFSDLWGKACIAQSVPVSKFIDQNKRSFYATVTGTP